MQVPGERLDVAAELADGVRADPTALEFDDDRSALGVLAVDVDGAGGSPALGRQRREPRLDQVRVVEDPLAEDDWAGWRQLAARAGDRVQLLADDLLATNAGRLERAVDAGAANAALVKPNQAGTISRAIAVTRRAQAAGWPTVVSARSGETCDATIADLAVALDAGQIKIGSLARSERLAKYNRLIEIDQSHDGGYAGSRPLAFTRPTD